MSITRASTLTDDFETFRGRIVLGRKQTERIESSVQALTELLGAAFELGPNEVFIQGSYANGTAIKPDPERSDGEYDVDVVVVCARDGLTPEEALAELREVIAGNGTYAEMIEDDDPKRPCVRLRYADEEIGGFHVDVVPARWTGGDSPPLEIPRPGHGWCETDPEGYRQWCKDQGEQFARNVQMLKRYRDHNQAAREAIKSIVLQVLTADHMPDTDDDAERVAGTLRRIADLLDAHPDAPPAVPNPVLRSENLTERWPTADYKNFRVEVATAADHAEDALAQGNTNQSRRKWRELFGKDFPGPTSVPTVHLDPGEKDLELHYGIPIQITDIVSINARVRPNNYAPGGAIAELSPLPKGRSLFFELARTTVPEPYDVYWKIKNTGAEAARLGKLRGEIVYDEKGPNASRPESTAYTGEHYVEIYIVKDGICRARGIAHVVIA